MAGTFEVECVVPPSLLCALLVLAMRSVVGSNTPFTTCNLSVNVSQLQVHIHGRPWSSVAVDAPTDVDQGSSSVADSGRCD
jgi:hypothetical protein